MRRYLSLVILALLTLIVAGAYFVFFKGTDLASSAQLYNIPSSDSIKEIQITNSFGEFLFEKEDDVWMLKEPGNYHVNQLKINLMEKALLDLQINRTLETELPEYGLTNPSIIVEFSTQKNIHKTLYIGNLTPSQSQIYLKDIDSGKIMIADIGTTVQFDGSLKAYRGNEVFSINKDRISEITYIQNGTKKLTLKYNGPQNWQLTYPFSAPARFLEISELIVKMRKWTSVGYIENLDGNYEKLGLVNPSNVLVLTDLEGKTQKVEFGNTENGTIAVRTGSKEDVVKLFSVDVDFAILSPEQLLFVSPLQTSIEKVSEIGIETQDGTSIFFIDQTKSPIVITISGKEVSYEDFISLFVKYIGLSANGYDDQTKPGQKFLSLTTKFIDGTTNSLNLLQRSSDSYFMEFSGEPVFYINKTEVNQFLNRLDAILGVLK